MWSNLSNNKKRYITFWAWVFISKISALIFLGIKYGFFSKETSTTFKWTFAVVLGFVWLFFTFWSQFTEWARDMKEGFLRGLVVGIGEIALPLTLWLAGVLSQIVLEDYLWFTGTILVTTTAGVVLRGFHIKYKRLHLIKEQGYVNVLK